MTSPGLLVAALLAALACSTAAVAQAAATGPASAPANTVKVVSAAVPNGVGGKLYVKIGYACADPHDVVLTVTTADPVGSGQATAWCGHLPLSTVVTVTQGKGLGKYASGTPVGIHAVSATPGGEAASTVEQQKVVTPT